jgi:hypothetical protein
MLAHVVDLESDIEAIQERIEAAVAPFRRKIEILDSIPGVGAVAAQAILAEIGPDMSVFPPPATVLPGPRCVPDRTSRPASADREGPGRARSGSAQS